MSSLSSVNCVFAVLKILRVDLILFVFVTTTQTTWKIIMLNELKHAQKAKYCTMLLVGKMSEVDLLKVWARMVVIGGCHG